MFGVIVGHCGWFSIILPSYNPIFVEYVRACTIFRMLGRVSDEILHSDLLQRDIDAGGQRHHNRPIVLRYRRISDGLSLSGTRRDRQKPGLDFVHQSFCASLHQICAAPYSDNSGARNVALSSWIRAALGQSEFRRTTILPGKLAD